MSRKELRAEGKGGSKVAARLKKIFYENEPWSPRLGFKDVPEKLTYLKKKLRPFYPNMDDAQMLNDVATWSDQDILEVFCDKV